MFDFSLAPDAGNFSIYVTNKTTSENEIFVRFRDDELEESVTNPRIRSEMSVGMSGDGEVGQGRRNLKAGINVAHKQTVDEREHEVNKCLTQAGFSFLRQGKAMPFAVGNSRLMYISVHDGSRSWCWNMPVNPQQYGCVTIKEDVNGYISIIPSNPEPHWIQHNENEPTFPSEAVRVHRRSNNTEVYLAKVSYTANLKMSHPLYRGVRIEKQYLTGVWRENGNFCRGHKFSILPSMANHEFNEDLLLAREYEWVKAKYGNKIPPNAVKTTLLIKGRNEELYVGRVGGERICQVSHSNDMINYFTDNSGSWTDSGEILLLTLDPSV